jgi:putative lipoic acid-binding regulatory protein
LNPPASSAALSIVHAHYGVLEEHRVSEQLSRKGTYVSLTITVPAASREEVDAVYRELTASDEILVVL